jgi:hypothetical protein
MTIEKFDKFIKIICKNYAMREVLVGSEIYDDVIGLDRGESKFKFIKCDLLRDKVIVFSKVLPLGNQAVSIDDIISIDEQISLVSKTFMAFLDNNNFVMLVDRTGAICQFPLNKSECTCDASDLQPFGECVCGAENNSSNPLAL